MSETLSADPQPPEVFRFGPHRLEVRERRLWRGGEPVALAPKHFDLLVALARRRGRLATKDELLAEVWPETVVTEASLAQAVSQLRRSLDEPAGAENGIASYIETVPKAGYRLGVTVEPVDRPPGAAAPTAPHSSRTRTQLIAVIVIGLGLSVLAAVVARRDRPERPLEAPPPEDATIEQLERLFAAAPHSVETGAELARKLDDENREQEALAVIARVRQIPGGAEDPRVDAIEAWIVNGLGQAQRALFLTTRALAHPLAADDLALRVRLRGVRGRTLSVLGRKDEAHAELERAVAESEQLGDTRALARNLNDLAIEDLNRGDFDRAEALFEKALATMRSDGDPQRGAGILNNLASIAMLRGRPDRAETHLREAIAILRGQASPPRLAFSLALLADALRAAGKPQEVTVVLDEAEAIARQNRRAADVAMVLTSRTDFAIDQGLLDAVDVAVREIEAAANATGQPRTLVMAEMLRGRAAAARGESAQARMHLEEARRLARQLGENENWSLLTLIQAEIERQAGEVAVAQRLAAEAIEPLRSAAQIELSFLGEALLARLAAEAGRAEAAARHLERCRPQSEQIVSVQARLGLLAARAELARLLGDREAARRDLEAALELARASWRKLDEQDLERALARLTAP